MSVTSMLRAGSLPFSCQQRVAIALLGFVTLLALTIPSAAAAQDSTRLTLGKMREDWVQDLRTKKLEPILKCYAPDAVFLQPNGDRLTGPATLRSFFQMIMSTFNSDLTLHSENLDVSGDLAYDSGSFEESLTTIATGARITSKGSYIIIYKRQANGNWEIVQHVWTGTPPAGT